MLTTPTNVLFNASQTTEDPCKKKKKKRKTPSAPARSHQASTLLAIIRNLRPESHVVHFAVLKLPSPVLEDPNIIASVINAPRLGGIVESILNPVRISDASKVHLVSSLASRLTIKKKK
jgi:hypothetical protein